LRGKIALWERVEQKIFVIVDVICPDGKIEVIVQFESHPRIDDEILVEALVGLADSIVVGKIREVATGARSPAFGR